MNAALASVTGLVAALVAASGAHSAAIRPLRRRVRSLRGVPRVRQRLPTSMETRGRISRPKTASKTAVVGDGAGGFRAAPGGPMAAPAGLFYAYNVPTSAAKGRIAFEPTSALLRRF